MSPKDKDIESYRPDGYLPGRRLLSAAGAERFREDCFRTCAMPLELGDQNPYSLKRHASNRVKPYSCFRGRPNSCATSASSTWFSQ